MLAVKIFLFIYNLLWIIVFSISLPWLPFFIRDRERFKRRLGLNLPKRSSKKKQIWIHALSVGEVISAGPIIKALRDHYPQKPIAFSVKTSQGFDIACRQSEKDVDMLFPMPLDFFWSIATIVNRVQPSVLLLVESDIWPGLILYLKKKGVKVVLINGRVSPKTFHLYKRFRFISRRLFNYLDICFVQSDLDRDRLLDVGVNPEKVLTSGNIKFDRTWPPMNINERNRWLHTLNIQPENRIWVAGSTHENENEIILKTYKRLVDRFPELILIIAPRKLNTTENMVSFCKKNNLNVLRRTDLSKGKKVKDVLILDTIGELGQVYGLAEITFVGGSLVPIGGHNLLEPASFGRPVLFGPYMHNFVLMSEMLEEVGGGKRVENAEELFSIMNSLLAEPEKINRMGEKAKEFTEKNKGALDRVMKGLGGYIAD